MKKFLCIVAVLLAFALMLVPKAPSAAAAGTAPGKQASVTFTYDALAGINGKFTISNPDMIDGGLAGVTYSWNTQLDGDVTNHFAFFTARDVTQPKPLSITVSFKIVGTALEGETCDISFKYEIYDENGDPDSAGTDKKTVTVEIPETQPTQSTTKPTTRPTQSTTRPTSPTIPATLPVQPTTQPTQPTTLPSEPAQPTVPDSQPPVTEPVTEDSDDSDRKPAECPEDDHDCKRFLFFCLGLLAGLIICVPIIVVLLKKKQQSDTE